MSDPSKNTVLLSTIFRHSLGLGLFAIVTAGVIALTQFVTQQRIQHNIEQAEIQILTEILPQNAYDNDLLRDQITVGSLQHALNHSLEGLGPVDSEEKIYIARQNGQITGLILPVIAPDGYTAPIKLRLAVSINQNQDDPSSNLSSSNPSSSNPSSSNLAKPNPSSLNSSSLNPSSSSDSSSPDSSTSSRRDNQNDDETTGNVTIWGVRVVSHKETPGLGDAIDIKKSDWILAFNDTHLGEPIMDEWKVKKDGGAFDQLTGATITPRAIVHSLKQTLLTLEHQTTQILTSLEKALQTSDQLSFSSPLVQEHADHSEQPQQGGQSH